MEKMKTVLRASLLLTISICLVIFFSSMVLAEVVFSASVDSSTVTEGDSFDVEVYINANGDDVRLIDLELLSSNTDGELSLMSATTGGLYGSGVSEDSNWPVEGGAGYSYAESSSTAINNIVDKLFVTISVIAVSEGETTLSFNSISAKENALSSSYDTSGEDLVITIEGSGSGTTTEDESSCSSGVDNDLDGLTGCEDSDCVGLSYCEATESTCNDGYDNDADGLIDCLDEDCNGISSCEFPTEITCNDGVDNDADGLIDCLDYNCDGLINSDGAYCELTESYCEDGSDNDGDGAIDCGDTDCEMETVCMTEEDDDTCSDTIDNDGDGAIDCYDSVCIGGELGSCEITETSCSDSYDNDADTFVDSEDSDCLGDGYSSGDGDQGACESIPGTYYEDVCYDPSGDEDGDGVNNEYDTCVTIGEVGGIYPSNSENYGCYYADIDGDGSVDSIDVESMAASLDTNYNDAVTSESGEYAAVDFNQDGGLSFADVLLFVRYYYIAN